FPGCVVEARPIGVLRITDEKGKDDKILCVATSDPRLTQYQELEDVPKHYLDEISEFFKTYKKLEEGKHTEVTGWEGREAALAEINRAFELFRSKFAYK
ncbi:MAG TPA: inorganic diphosphatase, partial [Methanomassiliicoccales archaeon]|nr:inorganic diphosphatase [Methanomassiliicoccales archaeon]